MKNIYLLILLMVLGISCADDDEIPSVTKSKVTFRITGLDYYAEKYQDTLIEAYEETKFNHWNSNRILDSEDSLLILKIASFNLYTEQHPYNTCDQLVIKLEKREAINNLAYDSYYSQWKYKSKNDELQLFYQNYDSAYIEFNQCYLHTSFSSARLDNGFKIHEITKVLVNGEEDWSIKATFEGTTANRHWVEDERSFFDIRQGEFEGVLK